MMKEREEEKKQHMNHWAIEPRAGAWRKWHTHNCSIAFEVNLNQMAHVCDAERGEQNERKKALRSCV